MALIYNKNTQQTDTGATRKQLSGGVGTVQTPNLTAPTVAQKNAARKPLARNTAEIGSQTAAGATPAQRAVSAPVDTYKGLPVSYHTAYTDAGTGGNAKIPDAPDDGSGSGGGGSSGGGGVNIAAYNDLLSSVGGNYAAQSAHLQDNLAAMNALYAQAAERAKAAQQQAYEYNLGLLDRQNVEGQRGLYVDMMQNQRRMNQLLAAQGIGGGAAESTQARTLNNYLSEQAALSRALQDNQSALAQAYQQALAQIEQERLAGEAGALGSYQSAAGNLGAAYLEALLDAQKAALKA